MNKQAAFTRGIEDYQAFGEDCPCPYDLMAREAYEWGMGWREARDIHEQKCWYKEKMNNVS